MAVAQSSELGTHCGTLRLESQATVTRSLQLEGTRGTHVTQAIRLRVRVFDSALIDVRGHS